LSDCYIANTLMLHYLAIASQDLKPTSTKLVAVERSRVVHHVLSDYVSEHLRFDLIHSLFHIVLSPAIIRRPLCSLIFQTRIRIYAACCNRLASHWTEIVKQSLRYSHDSILKLLCPLTEMPDGNLVGHFNFETRSPRSYSIPP